MKIFFFDERAWLSQLENFLDIPKQKYSKKRVKSKINVSEESEMPDWFTHAFAKDVDSI